MITWPKLPLSASLDEDDVWLISDADGDEVAWLTEGDKETAEAMAAGPSLKALNAELVKALEELADRAEDVLAGKGSRRNAAEFVALARAVLAKARDE